MIVLIDDERDFINPLDGVVILRTSKDALNWLNAHRDAKIDQLWFDHDLGKTNGVVDSTIPVVRWIEEQCFFDNAPTIEQVVVHTSNNVGGKEIVDSLSRYYPTVRVFAGDYLVNR